MYSVKKYPSKHDTSTQCWSTVYDAGPTLDQHWVDVSCLLRQPYLHGSICPALVDAMPPDLSPRLRHLETKKMFYSARPNGHKPKDHNTAFWLFTAVPYYHGPQEIGRTNLLG